MQAKLRACHVMIGTKGDEITEYYIRDNNKYPCFTLCYVVWIWHAFAYKIIAFIFDQLHLIWFRSNSASSHEPCVVYGTNLFRPTPKVTRNVNVEFPCGSSPHHTDRWFSQLILIMRNNTEALDRSIWFACWSELIVVPFPHFREFPSPLMQITSYTVNLILMQSNRPLSPTTQTCNAGMQGIWILYLYLLCDCLLGKQ